MKRIRDRTENRKQKAAGGHDKSQPVAFLCQEIVLKGTLFSLVHRMIIKYMNVVRRLCKDMVKIILKTMIRQECVQ